MQTRTRTYSDLLVTLWTRLNLTRHCEDPERSVGGRSNLFYRQIKRLTAVLPQLLAERFQIHFQHFCKEACGRRQICRHSALFLAEFSRNHKWTFCFNQNAVYRNIQNSFVKVSCIAVCKVSCKTEPDILIKTFFSKSISKTILLSGTVYHHEIVTFFCILIVRAYARPENINKTLR